ncbi:MAG: hypothetical protein A3I68_08885 [Candidatus Melainabacteria bacterium RIFCSPLOWO2_02_FULL_35_15]|nr:MAG: hypothetical protein A3F80_05710 [Candidatus Melainabacteria bacterium RIFCSPLOWO2_12_FULL_35_11]OGI13901.1 MAG: hypothetical protein A3I68_08885 [Candidatus Melainabacteria bacterium RIFCSPLOWO2_02_FULL_35_15]
MTLKASYRQRTFLDPIHGPIKFNLNDPIDYLLTQIIDTKEFQRLRRIRQMGLGWFTFHGAEHTRFGHSIGAMFIAKKIIAHLSDNFEEINKYKARILVSALIHDIGHGPFSHTSEKLLSFNHEDWTRKIIQGDSKVHKFLIEFDKNFLSDVIEIMSGKETGLSRILSQIISSYVDCDRLDYLHRDSYYVGVPYGLTGSERIIASFEVDKESKRLVINENIGLDAVIHYLHARYSMYQQVYQHKKNLACDFLLRKIIERLKEINPKTINTVLYDWLNADDKPVLRMDDFYLMSCIQDISEDPTGEKVLKDLSNRFTVRNLFKSLEFRQEVITDKITEVLEKLKPVSKNKGFDPNFYLGIEQSASTPYEPYQVTDKTSKTIFIKQNNGIVRELSEVSGLVKALSQENIVKTCLVFAPELEDEITNTKGFQELFK